MKATQEEMTSHPGLQTLKPADVLCSYRGKMGCMCGCRGTYHVTVASRSAATRDRGYAYDDSDVSDLAVMKVLRQVQAQEGNPQMAIASDFQYVVVNDPRRNRCIAVYLTARAKRRLAAMAV